MGKTLKKYLIEIVILITAAIVGGVSLFIFLNSGQVDDSFSVSPTSVKTSLPSAKIFVDISGSVIKPGLYEASEGARLQELLKKTGGLSDDADKDFFARNYNLSRFVVDQEKIYIPSIWEVNQGYFIENTHVIDSGTTVNRQSLSSTNQTQVNINSATLEELDTLPGVGKITGQKIIDNRPFGALEELLDKKIINKSTYENIKDLISL